MAVVFSESFESGTNGATLTSSNTGYTTITGAPVFDNTTRVSGTYSARFTATGTGSAASSASKTFTAAALRFMRRFWRLDAYAVAGSTLTLMKVRSGSTVLAQVVVLPSGLIQLRNGTTVVATTVNPAPLGGWFRIEWEVDATNAVQNFQMYTGSTYNSGTATETATGAYTGGAYDTTEDGIGTAGHNGTVWLDVVASDDADWPGPVAGANVAPTANAGPDQTVASGVSVTLDGTGSSAGSGATVATYSWTQVSGTAVTLSSPGAAKPIFTAPTITSGSSTLVFGLTVTDSNGVASSQDAINVTVNPQPATAFAENFDGAAAANGAVITATNTAYSTIAGNVKFDSSAKVTGGFSAACVGDGTAASASTLSENITATSSRYVRRYYRISAVPATTSMIFFRTRISGTGTSIAQVALQTDGTVQLRNGATAVWTSATPLPLGTWFRLEHQSNGGASQQTLNLYLLDNVHGSTPDLTSGAVALTGGNFDRVQDGVGSASYLGTVWVDAAADVVASWPGASPTAIPAPTCNAGADQAAAANATVTLDGTGSTAAGGGTVTGYQWSQTSGTAVALSSATVARPTFTAPNASGALVFSLKVTDSNGMISAADTITVTVGAPATALFTEDFDGAGAGQGTTITTSNVGYGTVTGAMTFDNTQKVNGTYAAKLVSDGSAAMTLKETFAGGAVTTRYFRRYFYLTAWPSSGSTLSIMRVRITSTTVAHLCMINTGVLQMRDGQTTVAAATTSPIPLNQWVRVEWAITGATQTCRIYYGANLNSATTPNETLTGAFSAIGGLDKIEDGIGNTAWIATMWIDAVVDYAAVWPGPASTTNRPPTANAGQNQLQILPGGLVTLDGSGSTDPDGTVASYVWTQTGGTTVTLSSTTAQKPTFTAPYTTAGDNLVFSLVVTDNAGAASAPATVTVSVLPSNEYFVKSGTWQISPPTLL